MSDKTLEELHAELDAAAEAYDAAPEGDTAEEAAWEGYCRANEDYKKKLKEIEDVKE